MTDRQTRATAWSLTINNPCPDDDECIALARQKGWQVIGQKEKGESGTEHYQLMLKTPQVRFSAVKKQFPRAHIEIARNSTALQQYVQKEETRVESLNTTQSMYPSQQVVWSRFALCCPSESDLRIKYNQFTDRRVDDPSVKYQTFIEFIEPILLQSFDDTIALMISEGLYCELIGVNPQVRSAVKKYGLSIRQRELNKISSTNINVITQTVSSESRRSSLGSSTSLSSSDASHES